MSRYLFEKAVWVLLSAALVVGFVPSAALAAPVREGNTSATRATVSPEATGVVLTYSVADGEATITGYDGNPVNLEVPAEIDGYPVIAVGDNAFDYCNSLENVIISEGVTSIGMYAFYECESLKSVDLPQSLETLGGYAFAECAMLSEIVLPDGLTGWIDSFAFLGCSSLESINIPAGIEGITWRAFYGCSSLESFEVAEGNPFYSSRDGVLLENELGYDGGTKMLVAYPPGKAASFYRIPADVAGLHQDAFNGCSSLSSIVIHDGVADLGYWTFFGLASPSTITVATQEQYDLLNGNEDYLDPDRTTVVLVEDFNPSETFTYSVADGEATITGYDGNPVNLEIPAEIDGYPVIAVGDNAFDYCDSLESVIISKGVTSIGGGAFGGCSSLKSVKIPDSVVAIGDFAFQECVSLTAIDIPGSVVSIGNAAFDYCRSLASVTISEGVESIETAAFSDTALTSIQIPSSVRSIASDAFSGCMALSSIEVDVGNGAYCDVDGVLYSADVKTLVAYPAGRPGASYEIPYGVTSIEEAAFWQCAALTDVTIPDSVVSIGGAAFRDCTSLAGIDIPSSVESIGNFAIADCSSLTSVDIPEGVDSIGYYAFYNCRSLSSVTIPESVTFIGHSAFLQLASPSTVTVSTQEQYDLLTGEDSSSYLSTDRTIVVLKSVDSDRAPVDSPSAMTGLVYTGSAQAGVIPSEGCVLSGDYAATSAGDYVATATLEEGCVWSDGTTGAKTIEWSIAPATLVATYEGESVAWGEEPGLFVSVTGFVSGETPETAAGYVAPTVEAPEELEAGRSYVITPSGGCADNYSFEYAPGTLEVASADLWKAFPDVAAEVGAAAGPAGVWYVSGGWLDYVVSNGIMSGYANGDFGPGDPVTRAQVAAILCNAAAEEGDSYESAGFGDVRDGDWYAGAVNWAYNKGVISGYDASSFGPNDPVTREQLAIMFRNYAALFGVTEPGGVSAPAFVDAGDVSPWAREAVDWCVSRGIIGGNANPDGSVSLDPTAGATRAQTSVIVTKVMRDMIGE